MLVADASGRALIERFEGIALVAYRCPAGVLTIGYGHTSAMGKPLVTAGLRMAKTVADATLASDLLIVEKQVNGLLKTKVNQNQFNALVSLTFNIGVGNFEHSHVLGYVNENQPHVASEYFMSWDRAAGRVMPGLVLRRQAEQKMFNEGIAKPQLVAAGSRFDMPRKVDAIVGVNVKTAA